MKAISSAALLLAAGWAYSAEPIAVGEWSEPVNRLRARLVLAEEDELFNGARIAIVYLELENLNRLLTPLVVDFDPNALHCEVTDIAGSAIPMGPIVASFAGPPFISLLLPMDSTLRFRISVSGYGIPPGPGVAIQLLNGFWFLKPDALGERFLPSGFTAPDSLAATFTVPKLGSGDIEGRRKDISRGNNVWRGTLQIPRLKIPVKRKNEQ